MVVPVFMWNPVVKDGKLTGTITMVSEKGTKIARLDLVKQ
jgi:hypothetical protein